jgi:hypothetical protein
VLVAVGLKAVELKLSFGFGLRSLSLSEPSADQVFEVLNAVTADSTAPFAILATLPDVVAKLDKARADKLLATAVADAAFHLFSPLFRLQGYYTKIPRDVN